MGRVKLPKAVAKALEVAAYDLGIDADDILKVHKYNPYCWILESTRALSGLDYELLENAIKKGFEIDMQNDSKLMVGVMVRMKSGSYKGQRHVIQEVVYYCGKPAFKMQNAYFYLSDEGRYWERVADDDNATLQPHDYGLLLDQALATGDKAWFDELVAKSKEVPI